MAGRAGGGLLSVGRSKAKIFAETDIDRLQRMPRGVHEAKAELQEIVEFLEEPAGIHPAGSACSPKGVLLVGPPGTGKAAGAGGRG